MLEALSEKTAVLLKGDGNYASDIGCWKGNYLVMSAGLLVIIIQEK